MYGFFRKALPIMMFQSKYKTMCEAKVRIVMARRRILETRRLRRAYLSRYFVREQRFLIK